jgi:hypothetical protein
MTTRNPNKSEIISIKNRMEQFINETYVPSEFMDPWDIVNQYFAISEDFEKNNKVYLRIGDKAYSIGEHSTLDISNARNFIIYFRTVFKNKLKQNE